MENTINTLLEKFPKPMKVPGGYIEIAEKNLNLREHDRYPYKDNIS